MRFSLRLVVAAAASLALLWTAFSAQDFLSPTSIITVTNTNDSGAGSLRQAIASAQDGDTVQFDPALNGQTIALTSGELYVARSITIHGPGANLLSVTRHQNASRFRIFEIASGKTVLIEGLTISNGYELSGGGISNFGTLTVADSVVTGNHADYPTTPTVTPSPGGWGGGISNFGGSLTVRRCVISNNQATASWASGGGISHVSGPGTTIIQSTITNNHADRDGGGIDAFLYNPNNVTVTDSTIDNNTADGGGGGIFSGNGTPLFIQNSTISSNTAGNGGGIYGGGTVAHTTVSGNSANQGGGFYNLNGPQLTLGNTILKTGASGANIYSNITVLSQGYNLSNDNGGGYLTGPGDQINTDPLLGPLQDNGGLTFTQMPLNGSPAIDMGDPNFTPPPIYDQRGFGYARVYNSRIDIGSAETQPAATISPTPTCPPVITQSTSQTVTNSGSPCFSAPTPFSDMLDNHYWRAFDMQSFTGGATYYVGSVSFGVAFPEPQAVIVRLYASNGQPFPGGTRTEIGSSTVSVPTGQQNFVFTAPLSATVPAGTGELVMELFTPQRRFNFSVGTNSAPETGPSYWSCENGTPEVINTHLVFNVYSSFCGTPTPSPTPVTISGTLGQCTTTGASGTALANVTMDLTGSSTASTLTNASGNYSFSVPSGGTYTITPSKATRAPGSAGLNTTDVIAIQRHFLQLGTPLSGCRLTAADCAPPSGITTGDVIAVQRFFLLFTSGIGNVGKYQFNPVNRSYPSLTTNQSAQNYDTIVFGDVATPFANP